MELPKGKWSPAQTAEIVARLRKSEIKKDGCGVDLLKNWDDVAKAYH